MEFRISGCVRGRTKEHGFSVVGWPLCVASAHGFQAQQASEAAGCLLGRERWTACCALGEVQASTQREGFAHPQKTKVLVVQPLQPLRPEQVLHLKHACSRLS